MGFTVKTFPEWLKLAQAIGKIEHVSKSYVKIPRLVSSGARSMSFSKAQFRTKCAVSNRFMQFKCETCN